MHRTIRRVFEKLMLRNTPRAAPPAATAAARTALSKGESTLSALDRLAGWCWATSRDAAAGKAEELRLLARHYALSAEGIAARSAFAASEEPSENFSEDDGSPAFVNSINVYVPGGEVEIGTERRSLPWAHLFSDPGCGIFLVGGQSNAANHGNEAYQPHGEAYVLNFMDLKGYRAGDPLPGASGQGGSIWSRLSDQLLARGIFERVLFVPVAFGGTYLKDWITEGPTRRRLTLALSRLRKRLGTSFLDFDAVFWQQGEAEANLTDMSAEAYSGQFRELARMLREDGVFCPIFLSQSTLCEGPVPHPFRNHDAIRQAQAGLWDASQAILRGPDTDLIGAAGRHDGCHLAAAGLQQAATLWLEAIEASRHLLVTNRRCRRVTHRG